MVNDYELAVIQEKTGWDLARIRSEVETLIVTEGEFDALIDTVFEPPARPA